MSELYSAAVTSTAYIVTHTLIGVKCDICEEIIKSENRRRNTNQGRYFIVTTGHHDWGLESPESVSTRDICPRCAAKFIEDYLADCSDTAYLNLEAKVVWGRKNSVVVDNPPKEDEVVEKEHDYY